nr:hypothetical protein [Oryza sativa Japonica Group]
MVRKANGKWRMCVDFTDLNKACPNGTPKPVRRLPSSSRGLPSPFAVVFLRAGHPR